MFDLIKKSFLYWQNMGYSVYHMVLTSSNDSIDCDLFTDFGRFIDMISKYAEDLEYFAIFTNEGNGTVHVLMNKGFPLELIRSRWSVVHKNSFRVSCDRVCSEYNSDSDFINTMSVYLSTQDNILDFCVSSKWFKNYREFKSTIDGINKRLM